MHFKKLIVWAFIGLSTFICNISSADNQHSLKVGTTFSQVQCEYLNLDWKDIYQKTLDMGFDTIRLGSYWSRIEKEEGQFDFSELDWQIDQAEKMNVKILLTVGMKAPRWPEFFIPYWVFPNGKLRFGKAISDNPVLQKHVLKFIEEVVNRYKDRQIITAWQVENEPLGRSGPKDLWIRKDFLQKEIDLVRKIDTQKRPIVINAMTYPNWSLDLLSRLAYTKNPIQETIDIADIPALDFYPTIGQKVFSKKVFFKTRYAKRLKYLNQYIKRAKSQNKSIWFNELQAEPWEPGQLVHLGQENAQTCDAESFRKIYDELQSFDIDSVYLWGVEYWFYRDMNHKDNSWLASAQHILSNRTKVVTMMDKGAKPHFIDEHSLVDASKIEGSDQDL